MSCSVCSFSLSSTKRSFSTAFDPKRLGSRVGPGRSFSKRISCEMAANLDQLRAAKKDLTDLVFSKNCAPILVRLAWHDSGTYNKDMSTFPHCGGANGSIRFKPEINHGANAGLNGCLGLLDPIKEKYPDVSYADLMQMGSAVSVEASGGPKIPMRYGRTDAQGPEDCPPEGNLPAGGAPFPDKAPTPGAHLKNIFYRMGLSDQEIVALSGAHTIGRAYKDRSGFGKESTKYTVNGPGTKGGTSWTPEWLKFDNSYFVVTKAQNDDELLVLETDACIFEDEDFKPFAEKYAADQDAFFADYSAAHLKLSELGVKWVGGAPVSID